MRLGLFFSGAAVLLAFGLLGFRILDLEQRVAKLDAVGKGDETDLQAHQTSPQSPMSPSPGQSGEARFRAVEQRLSALENAKQGLRLPSDNVGSDRMRQEQAILSVMERENSRIRDVQLEWHKARWVEVRKQQLAAFAHSQKLAPTETTKLFEAMEHELDGLVEVMKRPTFAEEPDQVAADWLGILSETDNRAKELLTPEQHKTYLQGRLFERKVLWPWLPDQPPETASR